MDHFSEADRVLNARIYDLFLATENVDGWSPGNKLANYQRLIEITEHSRVPLEGASCLDVGCGTGDLSAFLRENNIEDYLGVDIFEPALVEARKKYDERFENRDILEWKTDERFDFAFCSGGLSIRLESDNYEFLEAMVRKMWELTTAGVGFNFLTWIPDEEHSQLFPYRPESVAGIVEAIVGTGKIIYKRDPDHPDQAHVYMVR